MSQEDVEFVKRATKMDAQAKDDLKLVNRLFGAFERREVDTYIANCDPDCEVRTLLAEAEGGVFRGHGGVRTWIAQTHEIFADFRVFFEQLEPMRDRLLVTYRIAGNGRGSGASVEMRQFAALDVRDGKMRGFFIYRERDEALRACGLEG